MQKVAVIVHNVRSSLNVGSILRTAEGAGVSCVYLSGYTPAPIDRFGRINKVLSKTALGAERMVLWKQDSLEHTVRNLKQKNYTIIAVEQHLQAKDYRSFKCEGSIAYIFGNEPEGLDESALKLADCIIHIPMRGKKESLNVSVAAGIVLFHQAH